MTETVIRLRLVATIIGSYLAALAPLSLLGPEGVWWIGMLLIGSAPLILITAVAAIAFPKRIIARPVAWSLAGAAAAIAISVVAMWMITGSAIGIASTVAAVPAAAIFCWLMRLWKSGSAKPAAD